MHVASLRVRAIARICKWRLNMFKKSRVAMIVAGAFFVAQTGVLADDAASLDHSSFSDSQQLTVFNPDGSSYSLTPVDIEFATLEPMYVSDESLGHDYYIVMTDDDFVMSEPIVIAALEEDVSMRPLAKDFSTIEENHRL